MITKYARNRWCHNAGYTVMNPVSEQVAGQITESIEITTNSSMFDTIMTQTNEVWNMLWSLIWIEVSKRDDK